MIAEVTEWPLLSLPIQNQQSTINNQQSSFLPLTSDLSDLSDLFISTFNFQLFLPPLPSPTINQTHMQ
jgi:hypothetical protein